MNIFSVINKKEHEHVHYHDHDHEHKHEHEHEHEHIDTDILKEVLMLERTVQHPVSPVP
jgi:hypothetical protein